MPTTDDQLVTIDGWPLGQDSVAKETELPAGALRAAQNVDLSDQGKPRRRQGYTQVYTGMLCHSVFSTPKLTVFVENGVLKQLYPDYSTRSIRSGLAPHRYLSYAPLDGELFWTNGEESGRVAADGSTKPWWTPNPSGQPSVAPDTLGGLAAGAYQVAVTFVSTDGTESGSSLATVVDVPAGGGITLENIPSGDADKVYVYVSQANGDQLFFRRALAMGISTAHIGAGVSAAPLMTQFLTHLPPGQILRHFNGRMLSAVGSTLFYTPPYQLGLTRLTRDFVQFREDISVVEPVADGVFVVADQTYFLPAFGTSDMRQIVVDSAKGVLGTGFVADAIHFALDGVQGDVACWFGTEGLVVGVPGGQVVPLTEGRIAVDAHGRGASLARRYHSIQQVLTSVQGQTSGFAASDSAVAEVRRHGVTI